MIREVSGQSADLHEIRQLFREYEEFIGISLCFQSFEEELDSLPGRYSVALRGNLYLAESENATAGCVAFYRVNESTCELKRLFVRPRFHGIGFGRQLMERAINDATSLGYQTMILDTLRRLKSAGALYQRLGFEEIEPYNQNPHPDVAYFARSLT